MTEPNQQERLPWRLLGLVLSMAFVFPSALLVGYALGWWLDKKLGTSPILVIVFVLLGFFAAVVELFRELKKLAK